MREIVNRMGAVTPPSRYAESRCISYTLGGADYLVLTVTDDQGSDALAAQARQPIVACWPQSAAELLALCNRVRQTGRPASRTMYQLGLERTVARCVCVPLPETTDSLLLTVMIEDVDEVLPSANDALRLLTDQLPVAVFWVDAQGRVIYVNQKQGDVAGYTVGDVLPLTSNTPHPWWVDPATHEALRWNVLPIAQSLVTGKSVERLVARGFPADGDDQAFLLKAQPVFDGMGRLTHVIVVQIDTTTERRAELHLTRAVAEMDAILNVVVDGVAISDRHGTIIRLNMAGAAILGWDNEADETLRELSLNQRVSLHDARLRNGDPLRVEAWPLRRALSGDAQPQMDISLVRSDGVRVIISLHAAPLRDPLTDEITGAVAVFRDVTALRQLDHMKNEFMSIASHELRTPLTSLLLASRLIQRWVSRSDRCDDLRRLAGDVTKQVLRMNQLINDMLDMTRINSDHFVMLKQPADVALILREAVAALQESTNRTIIITGIAEAIPAQVDGQRIQQAITNILCNALKFAPPTAPIRLSAEVDGAYSMAPHLRITIRDEGIGIAADRLPHLFEHLSHGDDASASQDAEQDGMGLGLFIAQAIIVNHGGQIQVESLLGHGTTFSIELPLLPVVHPLDGAGLMTDSSCFQ